MFHEPHGKAATLARREAQPRVCLEGQLDAAADHLTVAAGMSPAVGSGGRWVMGLGRSLSSGPEAGWVWGHETDPTALARRPTSFRKKRGVPATSRNKG